MSNLECQLNPPNFDAQYLANLNTAFGSWGDADLYDWVFARQCGSFEPAQMILSLEDEVIAGSGVSFRKLRLSTGSMLDVGIMTGSWTLPAARGQGCFSRIIDESVAICDDRDCGLLLAFVTYDNPSRRRLESAGSAMFPTHYVFTGDEALERELDVSESTKSQDELYEEMTSSRSGLTAISYPSQQDFRGQFFERAFPSLVLSVGRATVIIEQTETTDRIVATSLNGESEASVFRSVAHRAEQNGRRFFAFTTSDAPGGLANKEGYLTALVANRAALQRAVGASELFDEADSTPLATPEHPYFLSDWRIDSGDRM